jgi:subtilisin family serine protease
MTPALKPIGVFGLTFLACLGVAASGASARQGEPEAHTPAGQAQTGQDGAGTQPFFVEPTTDVARGVRESFIFRFGPKVETGKEALRANEVLARHGGTLGFVYKTAFRGFSARMTEAQARDLINANPDIEGYERDGVVTILSHRTQAQRVPWGITRIGGYGDCGAISRAAWVIDTGIQLNHPDLKVDTARSKTFVPNTSSADDGHGHGTHVAGTIGAKNNTRDVVGVCAGATQVAVRVLNSSGSGQVSWVIAGVDYVAANFQLGDVANMSLGGSVSASLDQAVVNAASKGIKFALAAGNSSTDANNTSPARANHANIFTVSAIDSADKFASFSNYGNPPIDYAAPGVGILSLWKGSTTKTASGTSMAAPHVAGILLLQNGAICSDGAAIGDPDGTPDPIAHRC